MAERPSIGFIGIGLMGEAMTRRLLDQGWRVTVWNLERERLQTVLPHGAHGAAFPADLAGSSDIVLLCVLNTAAVDACVFGANGIAAAPRPPSLLIDLSTADPDETERMAARLAALPGTIPWVDAPVSGGPAKARDGTLAIMAGGTEAGVAAASSVLADLGTVTHMGGIGAGQRTKIVNQAIVGTGYVLMAEALALAEASGINAEKLPACLAGGMADGTLLQVIFRQMQARDFDPPRGYARQLMKDLLAVRDFARAQHLALPVVETAVAAYGRFAKGGNEMRDSASVSRAYNRARA